MGWTGTTLTLLPCIQTSYEAHPATYPTGTASPFPAGKVA